MKETALIVRTENEERAVQLIGEMGVKNLNISPQKVASMLRIYGEETTTNYLMIKWEGINPSIHKIQSLLTLGLSFDQVKTIYLTRETIQEIAGAHQQRLGVSLIQLSRLIEQFPDFKEMETDEQVDTVLDIIKFFGWRSSFRDTITAIIEKAQELNISEIAEFIEAINEFASGDIHETFFPNWERG